MTLAGVFRKTVKVVGKVFKSVRAEVTHFEYASQDLKGARTFSPPTGTTRKAVVVYKPRKVRLATGDMVDIIATLIFPEPLLIDERDQFTLPSGETLDVVSTDGTWDPGKSKVFALKVWVG